MHQQRYSCPAAATRLFLVNPIALRPFPSCQVCTEQLGMCTANSTSSEPCIACKASLAQMAGSFKSQRDYYSRYGSSES